MADPQNTPGALPEPPPAAAPRGKAARLLKAYKWPLVVGAACAVLAGGFWYFERSRPVEPAALLATAFELLKDRDNPKATVEARKIASHLDALRYRDPKFPGAVAYVLGILDFRRALTQTDRERIDSFSAAAAHLEQAELGTDAAHRLQVEFALGISRHSIGDAAGAEQPLLRVIAGALNLPAAKEPLILAALRKGNDSVARPAAEFFQAAAALEEIYLDGRNPAQLSDAIAITDVALRKVNIEPAERDQTLLRRAQILVTLHDNDQAENAIRQLSNDAPPKAAALVRAQVDIAEGSFAEARRLLLPLAVEGGLDRTYSREALYLWGVCCEAEKDFETALRKYADVVRMYPTSAEGFAATVRRAELLRRAQRWEEALEAYIRGLEMIRPTGFSNRWLRLDEFRPLVVAAWEDLRNTHAYEFAVELARHMRPLFPPEEAYEALERVATANRLWTAELDADLARRPYRIREERQPELLDRWRITGKAYADLADSMHESKKYADILWISAEHYRQGHAYSDALVQMTRFINAQPRERLPLAYVQRGEILMDLGRYDEALDHFERVLAEYPTDIAAFQAMYLVGACEVERNHPQRAIEAWQRILHDGHLNPSANEWQASLFAVGRLEFQLAMSMTVDANAPAAEVNAATPVADGARMRPRAAFDRLDDAIRRLEEFVARYPKRPEAPEARFLLARSLRMRTALPRQKLQRAETDNARKELHAEIRRLLEEAQDQLETLIEVLQARETAGLLDPLAQRMLRDAYFERGHNLYSLERYERAIEAYTNASNRYAEDPCVLLAYLQIANCYDRLHRAIDARGISIQAMLIHKNMPEAAFAQDKTALSRDEWKAWLEWAAALHSSPRRDEPTPATTASSGVSFQKSS
jgi:tetratricopeptide (TPR) repeat protein